MTGIAAHNQTTLELVETFRTRAEPVGTVVDHVRGTAEAALVIAAAAEATADDRAGAEPATAAGGASIEWVPAHRTADETAAVMDGASVGPPARPDGAPGGPPATMAMVSAELAAAAPALIAALDAAGVETVVPADAAAALDHPIGLSLARRAVAETGSVLLAEPDLPDRATAMVTDFNITVCRTADLVRSLDDVVADLRSVAASGGGGYATLVTGPSRTADIEMSLTVGVQGPKRVAVLFVDELA